MTTMPSPPFRPTPLRCTATDDGARTVRLQLRGDLDYDHAEQLLVEVRRLLADHPALRELRLQCAELGTVDSMGLSILLMVHRATTAADVRLHLDHRTPALDRLLQITGTHEHFTAPAPADGEGPAGHRTEQIEISADRDAARDERDVRRDGGRETGRDVRCDAARETGHDAEREFGPDSRE